MFSRRTDDPAHARARSIALTALTSVATKATNMAVLVISYPLTIGYLGPEKFGIWATLASIATILAITDLGLGASLANEVARMRARGDSAGARTAVSSVTAVLLLLCITASVTILFSLQAVDLAGLLNFSPALTNEVRTTSAVFLLSYLARIPLGVSAHVLRGSQQQYVDNGFATLGNVLSLALLFAAVQVKASLPVLALASCGGRVLGAAASWVAAFLVLHRPAAPSLRSIDVQTGTRLIRTGGGFAAIQLCVILLGSLTPMTIARFSSPVYVGDFVVANRLYVILLSFANTIYQPLWITFTDALARSDLQWVRRTLRRTTLLGAWAMCAGGVVFTLAGPFIARLWVGNDFSGGHMLFLGFAVAALTQGLISPTYALLQANEKLRVPTIIAYLAGASSLGFLALAAASGYNQLFSLAFAIPPMLISLPFYMAQFWKWTRPASNPGPRCVAVEQPAAG